MSCLRFTEFLDGSKMGKQEIIFQDAYGARLIVRPHMIDQRKFVLLIVPRPIEVTIEELAVLAAKLSNIAILGKSKELWREKKRS